jgi:Carboxypeptidase regulatory-like domain
MTSRPSGSKGRLLAVVALCAALAAVCWSRMRSLDSAARDGKLSTSGRGAGGPSWQTGAADDTSIAGRVVDAEQRPIAKAEVCANVASYASRTFRAAVCTLSDEQGAYQLNALEPLSYTVTANAAGFVATTLGHDTPLLLRTREARTGVDLCLRPGEYNLHGSVVDATGGPVPNANVRAERALSPRLVVDSWTDDLGNFSFAVPEGPVLLQAKAPGYSSASEPGVAPAAGIRLVLVPGASLRGRVVSTTSGLAVAGVELRAEPVFAQPEPLYERPRSDAQGHFSIEGLEPGSYAISAVGSGLRGQSDAPFELSLGEVIDGIEISMRQVARVSGRVLQSDGQSCARGSVLLGAPDPLHPLPDSTDHIAALMQQPPVASEIGADGAVLFAAVEPGKYYVTVRCHGQMLREGPRVLDVKAEDATGLLWTVGEGASLRVLTVDERDQPVGGVAFTVQLPSFRAYAEHSLSARSDAAGRYDIEGILSPGTYKLVAASYYSARPSKVEVRAGEQNVAKLKLVGSAAIEATLRAGGEPIAGMSVSAVPLDAAGGASVAGELSPAVAIELGAGRYRMAPLPAGRYEVRVDDGINPSVSSESIEIAQGEKAQLEIALDRAGKISGRVLDDRGSPVADAWVTAIADALTAAGGANMQRAAFATLLPARVLSDAQGEFSFERLAAGTASYTLQVSVPGAGAAQARAVRAGNAQLELVLRAVGSIAGSVAGVCGKGSGYNVAIQAQSLDTGQMLAPTTSSPDGSFVVSGVAPGAVRISAYCEHASGLVLGVATAQLAPGQKLEGVVLSLQLRGQGHDVDPGAARR